MGRLKIQHLFLITIFVISTCGLIYELIAGTLASYLLGDSITQFSLIIGIYLFSMGVGSFFSKFIKKNLISKFIEIEILIGFVGGLSAPILFLLFDIVEFFEFYLYLFVFLIGVLVGLEIPLLMIILKDKFEFTDLVANVFTYDYIGALLASILFPLFFIPYLGLIETSVVFGIINILIAFLMIFTFKKSISNSFFLKLKAVISLALLVLCLLFSNKILSFSEKSLYGENIIISKNSKYQRIVLTHDRLDYKLYLNNNLQFSSLDEYRYHEMLVHPVMSFASKIDEVLVLGGGDGMAVREILKYKDVKNITLVDLDSEMTKMFQGNQLLTRFNNNSLNNSKVKVLNKDAFVWLAENNNKYDVIIVDFPDPSNFSLGKLYSVEFYKKLKTRCHNNTKIVIQSTSPYFAPISFWCINNTVSQVFRKSKAYHVNIPSFGEWGFNLVASNQNILKPIRKLDSLKFYEFNFDDFTSFPKDMRTQEKFVNKLNNQILVSHFNKEWGKY
jgi:spermidine synthase